MLTPKEFEKKFQEWIATNSPKRENTLPLEQQQLIQAKLGYPGRMLSGSKQSIKNKDGREHLTVWNANLIVEGFGKVWFGDIDITNEEADLKAIAKELNAKVYVLLEMDARFNTENNPRLSEAIYVTDGVTAEIHNPNYSTYYERDAKTEKYLSKEKSNG